MARRGDERFLIRDSLGPSAAMLVLNFTGGSDDDWWRWTRNWRAAWLATRVVLYASQLVMPLLIQGLLRTWATGRLGRR